MDTLTQLVDSDVGWRTDQYLATTDLAKVVDDGSGSNCLSRTWRALDQAQRLLQNALYCVDLTAVQLWKAWHTKLARNGNLHGCRSYLMAKEAMENVTGDTHLIDGKGFHGMLHAVE